MFQRWVRLMPVCFVVWASRKWLSRTGVGSHTWHRPWLDVMVMDADDEQRIRNKWKADALREQAARLEQDEDNDR